mgnify:CR=1 FL=1
MSLPILMLINAIILPSQIIRDILESIFLQSHNKPILQQALILLLYDILLRSNLPGPQDRQLSNATIMRKMLSQI